MRDVIATKEGPQAIGPYSQAIRANGFVFVSGQVAIDPANQQVIGTLSIPVDRMCRQQLARHDAQGKRIEIRRAVALDGDPRPERAPVGSARRPARGIVFLLFSLLLSRWRLGVRGFAGSGRWH